MLRPAFRVVALVTALASVAPHSSAAAGPPGLTVSITPAQLKSDFEGQWPLLLRVRNAGDYGIYGDSIAITIRPLDPPGAAPVRRVMNAANANVSAGDSLEMNMSMNASANRADIVLGFMGHDHSGAPFEVVTTAHADGSVLDDAYPTRSIQVGRASAEMIVVPASPDAPNGPGVLLVPDDGRPLRAFVLAASKLARQGVCVVLVKPSGDAADHAGPRARAVVAAALDTLAHQPGVLAQRLGAWGVGWGANAVLLPAPLALRAIVAQSAHHDPWASFRALPEGPSRAEFVAAAGRDSAAWKARATLTRAGTVAISAGVLVLHGENDAVAPASPAHAFVAAAKAAGASVEPRFLPQADHTIGEGDAYRWAARFLNSKLGGPH